MEVDNPSTVGSKSKSSSRKVKQNAVSEDDLSMSDLILLANQNKVKKDKLEMDVEDLVSKKADESEKIIQSARSPEKTSKTRSRRPPSTSAESDIDSSRANREKTRKVNKENKDDVIRREKSTYLYKINMLNQKKNISHIKLDMNCSLEEIKNEFERIRCMLENEKMTKFCKQMLLMGVQGVEMLNTRFDPMGVDLDGWSEAMGYSMENQEYDEVLSELYEKYKGKGQMSPELKLVMMICGSAAMFAVTKKLTKMDTSNDSMFNNILGSFMNQSNQAPQQYQQPPQQYQPPPQQYQPPPQQYQPPPQQYQPQFQGNFQIPPLGMNSFIPSAADLRDARSDASSDMPSKIRGPNGQFDSPDSIDLQNIIKTMNDAAAKKKQKSVALNEKDLFETEEPEEKQIKQKVNGKGRGRPTTKAKTTRGVVR
jgi:hypothetical protein